MSSLRFVALLVAFASWAYVAEADSPDQSASIPVRLAVDAPSGCPDRAALLAQLQARSARIREASASEPARSVSIELRPGGGRVIGALTVRELDGKEGRRELRGEDCESVASGLALVAAVILDPSAAPKVNLPPPPTPSPPPPSPPASAEPAPPRVAPDLPPSPPPRAARPVPRGPPIRFSVGTALAIATGTGPDLQVVPRLFVDAELPGILHRVSARLSGGRGFAHAVDTASGTADITLTDVRFEPCYEVGSPASLRVLACGVVDGAVLEGDGANTTAPQSATRSAVELGLGLRPTWIVRDWLTLGLLVGAAVPLTRYRFYFAPDTTAYRLDPWSAFAEGSAGLRF